MARIDALPDILSEVFSDLRTLARENEKELDDSFFLELLNYNRRIGISHLPEEDLQRLTKHFGKLAIVKSPDVRVGAEAVRIAIVEECDHPFLGCNRAAARHLGKQAARTIEADVQAMKDKLNEIV